MTPTITTMMMIFQNGQTLTEHSVDLIPALMFVIVALIMALVGVVKWVAIDIRNSTRSLEKQVAGIDKRLIRVETKLEIEQ